jgi:hypothetical protein
MPPKTKVKKGKKGGDDDDFWWVAADRRFRFLTTWLTTLACCRDKAGEPVPRNPSVVGAVGPDLEGKPVSNGGTGVAAPSIVEDVPDVAEDAEEDFGGLMVCSSFLSLCCSINYSTVNIESDCYE